MSAAFAVAYWTLGVTQPDGLGGNGHDSAPAGREHPGQHRMGAQERALHVAVDDALPLLQRDVDEPAFARQPGVVHQDVRPSEFLAQLRNGLGDRVGVGDVRMQRDGSPTRLADLARDGLDLAAVRPRQPTATPRLARRIAVAHPMPEPAPVTSAI